MSCACHSVSDSTKNVVVGDEVWLVVLSDIGRGIDTRLYVDMYLLRSDSM